MDCLVNIIHPYTYKLTGDTFNIGPMEEYAARDRLFSRFVKEALDSGARVLHHKDSHPYDPRGVMRELAFMMDKHYQVLEDPRIDYVVTTPMGCPIADRRPKKILSKRWNEYAKYFTSHTALKEKVGHPDLTFFIGGAFEARLANAAGYHEHNYRSDGERMFYIPDLCVCVDKTKQDMVEEALKKRDIETICVAGALKLMSKN